MGEADQPTEGRMRTIRSSILRDGETLEYGRPAMPVGWDTRAVLAEAGFAADEIDALIASGAAQAAA